MTDQTQTRTAFPRLFEPFTIGRTTLANRLVMLPHGTSMVAEGGITDDDIAYYEARARTRPGMMVTGAAVVDPTSAIRSRKLVEPYNEAVLEGLAKRAAAVRAHGVAIVGQLVHLGREMIGGEFDNAPLAPSALRSPRDPFPPHVMDEAEIARIVESFGICAANLQRTGHDGIEIHAAHGYLVGQFLSPATNLRTDAWGGTPEKRLRFLREVIESIRKHCGRDFMLGLRLSADEELADGLEIRDTVKICETIAHDGLTDYLSITLGTRGGYVKDATAPEATAARAAGIIRQASGLPVIVGQRINRPEVAERILADGQADLVGMARAFIADAQWALKAARGESARIRPCLGLNQDCRSFSPHLHCAVNPEAGRERLPLFAEIGRSSRPRRLAVIGGGPGGLEAARIAALRGHKVTVFEAGDGVGGQFLYAASLPHRADLRRLIDWLQAELRHAAVKIELDSAINAASDLGGAFDTAIVATGAEAKPVDEDLRTAGVMRWFDVLDQGAPEPKGTGRALVIDDGSGFWWTYGTAEALMNAGWSVLLATPSSALAGAIPQESIGPLLARLARGATEYRVTSVLGELEPGRAQLMNAISGAEEWIACDLVVMQTGRVARAAPFQALRAAGIETHAIGDCVAPRRVSHALFDAQQVARKL